MTCSRCRQQSIISGYLRDDVGKTALNTAPNSWGRERDNLELLQARLECSTCRFSLVGLGIDFDLGTSTWPLKGGQETKRQNNQARDRSSTLGKLIPSQISGKQFWFKNRHSVFRKDLLDENRPERYCRAADADRTAKRVIKMMMMSFTVHIILGCSPLHVELLVAFLWNPIGIVSRGGPLAETAILRACSTTLSGKLAIFKYPQI